MKLAVENALEKEEKIATKESIADAKKDVIGLTTTLLREAEDRRRQDVSRKQNVIF